MTTNGKNPDQRTLIKNALLKIDELQAKLKAYEAEKSEPIAIVGMGCRFPGGADSPEAFWQLLENGQDTIREVPPNRWDINAYFDPDPDAPGKMSTRYGGFIDCVDEFDAHFFGIAPREAASMDPQQRILLEVAWQALEQANIPADRLYGRATGVFIGIISQDYSQRLLTAACADRIDAYAGTGASLGMAAGRLSYCLGLTGPSFSLDTACSSSLVTVHLACESLRRRECELALTGGVNLMLEPGLSINFSKARMLAPDGRCKTFDAAADGYVRGEGCGILVLKRLSDAQQAGDRILAVIRGSAVNQDGPSGGLTVPSGPAQEQVIHQALSKAGVAAESVSYIEAHGTGTALGDPIELGSLDKVFGLTRTLSNPLYIGSVKTNVGHLEAAAGVVGLIKLVLALQHECLPAHLHCQNPTPRFPWATKPLQIVRERRPWPRSETPRIAGISSFGFSGTNAHIVIAEAPCSQGSGKPFAQARVPAAVGEPASAPLHLLTVSARSEAGLAAVARRYRDYLVDNPNIPVRDICASAAIGRSHLTHRLAVMAASTAECVERLETYVQGAESPQVMANSVATHTQPCIAFLFTGQGAQYPGMGRQLYQTQAVFRQAIDRCAELLRPLCDLPLTELLFSAEAKQLEQTLYTQPALFCLEYALAELWRSWGVRPDVVLGHSVGEYVAACVAGVFGLEDGLSLIAARARLMQALPQDGGMAVVFASEEHVCQALGALTDSADRLSIAAINGPENIVLSGDSTVLRQALSELQAQGVRFHQLSVSHAFHSPLMEPMLAEFAQIAAEVAYRPPVLPLISNLTGRLVGAEIAQPAYWVKHVRQAVRFADSIATLRSSDFDVNIFVEIGPKPVLLGMVQNCCPDEGVLIPSLRQPRGQTQDPGQLLRALAELYVQTVPIDWRAVYRDHAWQPVTLPTYAFQRQQYWIDSPPPRSSNGKAKRTGRASRTGPVSSDRREHPLLGRPLVLPAMAKGEVRYEQSLDGSGFVRDHRVFERAILPAAAYVEMGLAAGANAPDHTDQAGLVLADVTFHQALIFADDHTQHNQQETVVQLVVRPKTTVTSPAVHFEIHSLRDGAEAATTQTPSWTLHASGTVFSSPAAPPQRIDLGALQAECKDEIDIEEFYQQCRQRGLDYGPDFQALQGLWHTDQQALGLVQLPEQVCGQLQSYHIHPVLLDACFQVLVATLPDRHTNETWLETWLPVGLRRLRLNRRPSTQLWCRAEIHPSHEADPHTLLADLLLFTPSGEVIGTVEGLRARKADPVTLLGQQADQLDDWFYHVHWQPQGVYHPRLNAPCLPAPSELDDALRGLMTELVSQTQLDVYGQALNGLEALCVVYILAAFQDLGKIFQTNEIFSMQDLGARLGIVDVHRQLFGRMLDILAEEGILQTHRAGWQVVQTPEVQNPGLSWQALRARYPQIRVELELVQRCGSALARVLQGECDPVQELLFPGGDSAALGALYRDTDGARVVNAVLRQSLVTALVRLPRRCGVRIIEIGAGTGGASAAILPALDPTRTEYVFTDISAAFTRQAETTFADYPFVQYATLDIEHDPHAQGFTLHDYDIVVASNVLHATEELSQTLQHARQLLAPGGMLVLLEGTAAQRWVDLVFGMTSGWWRFRDTHLRASHPLLSGDEWCAVLHAGGFQHATSIDCPPIHQAVILAQAAPQLPERQASEHWLIFADSGSLGQRLKERVGQTGATCSLVYPGDQYERTAEDSFTLEPYQAEQYHRVFAELSGAGNLCHCVHLWSLDVLVSNTSDTSSDKAHPSLVSKGRLGWESSLYTAQALIKAELTEPPRLTLVTRGAISVAGEAVPGIALSPVWGLGKSIGLEYPELRCSRIDLDGALASQQQADEAAAIFAELTQPPLPHPEDQVALRADRRYVARLTVGDLNSNGTSSKRCRVPAAESYALGIPAGGSLEALGWQPIERQAPQTGEVEIQIQTAGLNFKDVLLALHLVPAAESAQSDGFILGAECAGEIVRVGPGVTRWSVGDRVLAMAPHSFARYVTAPVDMVMPLPDTLSFEDGATIPIAFVTAAYALEELAKLRPGERVLIHAATGGVGQAAVQLAQRAGAQIFATASQAKWDVLRELGVGHIMDSRSVSFADEIRQLTHDDGMGEGVDVVLNSLRGEFTTQSLSLLRPGGRFLEIGVTDIRTAEEVAELAPRVTYHAIDLMALYQARAEVLPRLLPQLLEAFQLGQLQPLPYRVFPIEEVQTAFRLMQQASHTGKLVLSFAEPPPAVSFHRDASYLITGGLGGLGLLVAGWLAEHGAGHLVLASRRKLTPEIEQQLQPLKQTGAQVRVYQADVSDGQQLAQLLAEVERSMPPLRGVIHAAGVLDDGIVLEQDAERFRTVLAPKVDGAWHLHQQTQALPLDFFLLFSSATSLLGSVGQSNHVSANAFLDALAHARRAQGLPGLSINWGAWAEVGYAAQVRAEDFLKSQGIDSIAPSLGLAALERVFGSAKTPAQIGIVPIDWSSYLQRTPASAYLAEFQVPASLQTHDSGEFRQLLEATPVEERRALLVRHITAQVSTVLGFQAETVADPKQGFFDMGMDSLTSVELRNRLQTSLGCSLPSSLALDCPNILALVDYVADTVLREQMNLALLQPAEKSEEAENLNAVAQLSEDEAEASLLKELEAFEQRELSS